MPARKILTPDERRELRRIGHALNVVVQIGDSGLSEGLMGELQRALDDHELIKVRLPAVDKDARREMIEALCEATGAALVQAIGRVALLHLPAEEPDPRKSNVLRYRLR